MIAEESDGLLRYLDAVSYQLACLLDIDGQHLEGNAGVISPLSSSSAAYDRCKGCARGLNGIKQKIKLKNQFSSSQSNNNSNTRVSKLAASTNSKSASECPNKPAPTKPGPRKSSRASNRRPRRQSGRTGRSSNNLEAESVSNVKQVSNHRSSEQHFHQTNLTSSSSSSSIQNQPEAHHHHPVGSSLDTQLTLHINDDMTLDHGITISPSATHLSPIDPSMTPHFGGVPIQSQPTNSYYINSSRGLVQQQQQQHHHQHHHHQQQHHQQLDSYQIHEEFGSVQHEIIPIALDNQTRQSVGQQSHQQLQSSAAQASMDGNSQMTGCYDGHQQHHHQAQLHPHHQIHPHHSDHDHHHNQHHHHVQYHQLEQQHTQWLSPTTPNVNGAENNQISLGSSEQGALDQVVSSISPNSHQSSIDQVQFALPYHHGYFSNHHVDQLDSFQQLNNDEFTNSSSTPTVHIGSTTSTTQPSNGHQSSNQQQHNHQDHMTGMNENNTNQQSNNVPGETSYDGQHQVLHHHHHHNQLHMHDMNASYHDMNHHHLDHQGHHLGHHHVMPLVNGIEPSSVILQDINLASATWSSPEDLYSI